MTVTDDARLLTYVTAMVTRIGAKRPRRIYLREWRESFDLTQEMLANRLGTNKETISRWESGSRLMNTDIMAAVADAFGNNFEPQDLYRHPEHPSADALLRAVPPERADAALTMLRSLKKAN